MEDVFDVAGYMRRVRRIADLSQRELAALLGVSHASVGRMETGAAPVDVAALSAVLGLAGLRLCVVDATGRAVSPVPGDVLRDHADRHFPSHLDVLPPADQPVHRGANPRKGRPEARGWYTLRGRRVELRDRRGVHADHPTVSGERRRLAQRRAEMRDRVRSRLHLEPEPECICADACFIELCVPSCPCQCEPDRRHPHHQREGAGTAD
jgi:transcriptional regulator with XRE-family HTH domain